MITLLLTAASLAQSPAAQPVQGIEWARAFVWLHVCVCVRVFVCVVECLCVYVFVGWLGVGGWAVVYVCDCQCAYLCVVVFVFDCVCSFVWLAV